MVAVIAFGSLSYLCAAVVVATAVAQTITSTLLVVVAILSLFLLLFAAAVAVVTATANSAKVIDNCQRKKVSHYERLFYLIKIEIN